jgi:hypothetical protein
MPFHPINIGFWPGRLYSTTTPLENRAPLPPALASQMDMGQKPSIDIAFNEPTIIQSQPVVPALRNFINLAEGVIALFDDIP